VSGRPAVGLTRFVNRPAPVPPPPEPERCELCGTLLGERHGHLVDRQERGIRCACRPCYLLFTHEGTAAGGRYRAVPDRYVHDPDRRISVADWEDLQIPVGMAFFLRMSDQPGVTAFYPSPAGATECLLNLDAWDRLVATQPMLAAAEPDVEAVLIRRTDDEFECFLVPIDACYQLVGTVRLHWRGFDGGTEARQHIEEFFANARAHARVFTP
jgi:Family of unknown function (DUF5947)